MKKMLIALLTISTLLTGCDNKTPVTEWQLIENCNLHTQACISAQGQQGVQLNIDPKPIPIARPLSIQVDLKDIAAETVQLEIAGINMYMGYNQTQLLTQNGRHWEGTSMLAFCTNEAMDWKLSVIITQKDGTQLKTPFQLTTRNR